MIGSSGYQDTFLYFGIGQGLIVVLLAFFMVAPKVGQTPVPSQNQNIVQSRRNFAPTEVLKQPIFWLMYFMFVIVGAGGLMVTANLKPIAADLKVDIVPVTLMGLTMTAITFAATIDRILNGLTRPFFGWVSDRIGRENTMFFAFGMEGIGIYLLYLWGSDPIWFVLLSGFVFFAWGEIYSLFPATCTDTFGSKFAATNAGLLYTAKGTAALLVPFANILQERTGSWDMVFIIAAAANILASVLAIAVLKPWRAGVVRRNDLQVSSVLA
jgi:OFA family oxalate/formate antiporter-like MFS transporter